ncbi:excinuclease ABC subunit UvrC [Entomospira culicis]|uniref:UvrABC system protein C n=1 Tax=Entomospira culicis TaxID=2719989 RepID=A0A968KZS3_9SPIO|nr:excinuclease ABC subunit UvrC [Entomospira culicis]NIZ19474.1 excinuclease ABC subunit UvrC [Entomospira culicis]NIZ69621.1 excinuclease ABC subunit UvrC [Entomospira culicis]WDI36732.1 excinuclease ABC subunit UvrC [Entomospira culicis]WDI38361.1 excinuclease ABC subunit UvrC [Entomospira culicis]
MHQDSPKQARLAHLRFLVSSAPLDPGVYLWRGAQHEVLYVGKAKHLKNRLKSYFNDKSMKTQHLLSKAHNVEFTVVSTEYEALVLENNLIKRYQPPYNIALRDQKTYPMIRITNEPFPRVMRTRTIVKDGSRYYGPYPGIQKLDTYLEIINKTFALRPCKPVPLKMRKTPCLYYHMKQCLGPCVEGLTTESAYQEQIARVEELLSGKIVQFSKYLMQQMAQASNAMEYERAATLRDALKAVQAMSQQQGVEDRNDVRRDYVGMAGNDGLYHFVVLRMREGKMLDKATFRLEEIGEDHEVLEQFLIQFYESEENRETDIVYLDSPPNALDLSRYFQEESAIRLKVSAPIEEQDLRLIRMAYDNAMLDLTRETSQESALIDLKHALGMDKLPRAIEGFDVAQLSGHFTVASLITFRNGLPYRTGYRRFRMKSIKEGEINDFKSLSEAVARRFTRLINEDLPLPDLLLVDGGKGQVSAVFGVLEALGLEERVALVGIAKREEELFKPNQSDPIILEKGSPALRVLQAIRDETHRVATSYNQKLRHKSLHLERLQSIDGIGPKRAQALLVQYGSLSAISRQSIANVARVAKINHEKARLLIDELKRIVQNEENHL